MFCPFCKNCNTSVKDSRLSNKINTIRRRRICESCKQKFTTFEKIHLPYSSVIKKSGSRKEFKREKIENSIATATRKTRVSIYQVKEITDKVLYDLDIIKKKEVSTKKIGETVLSILYNIDITAYIRFASVYKEFLSLQDFIDFIDKTKKKNTI